MFVALQNHPKYSSVAPTPENPQLPANPDELPSASSRHDLDGDEESLEGGDAESSPPAHGCGDSGLSIVFPMFRCKE